MAKSKKSDKTKNVGGRPRKRGVADRQSLYVRASKHFEKALETTVELLDSRNEAIRLGAAKVILNKTIPDLKATELSTRDDQPILIKVISEISLPTKDDDRLTNKKLPKATGNI